MPATESAIWNDATLNNPHAQPDKARRVRGMFDAIAPTYERVNRVLSAGRDAHWRRRAVALSGVSPTDRVLDVACGTGDLTRAFLAAKPAGVVGTDFSAGMLRQATGRTEGVHGRASWCRADALTLPIADATFDIVSCAFGVRNFQQPARGLAEFRRILRPGGRVCILEFTMPRSAVLGSAYLFYFRHVLPRLASWISRDRTGAYDYLPQSVCTFMDVAGMTQLLDAAGFSRVTVTSLTGGIAAIYTGVVP